MSLIRVSKPMSRSASKNDSSSGEFARMTYAMALTSARPWTALSSNAA